MPEQAALVAGSLTIDKLALRALVAEASPLESRAQRALATSPVFALRELKVAHRDDALHIVGAVASFYHKQLAQEVVRSVAPEARVLNHVDVR